MSKYLTLCPPECHVNCVVLLCVCFSSYLHCEWKAATDLERDKRIQMKIKRYRMKQLQLNNYFNQVNESYCTFIVHDGHVILLGKVGIRT